MAIRPLHALLCLLAFTPAQQAGATDYETMEIAFRLGDIVGSAKFCKYLIDPAKLTAYIEKHVPADDLSFTKYMSARSHLINIDYPGYADGMKTAHCFQMARLVKSLDLGK